MRPSIVSPLDGRPLIESEYFSFLEYRVCGEIVERAPKGLRGLWCDGMDPFSTEEFEGREVITGTAHMMNGSKLAGDGRWKFYVMLPVGTTRSSIVDWSPFLPPEDAQGWLEIDDEQQTLTAWISRWGGAV